MKEDKSKVEDELVIPVTEHQVFRPEPNRTNHTWKQHGISVDCTSCDPGHGFHIRTDQLLTGIDENGYPIIKSITASRVR